MTERLRILIQNSQISQFRKFSSSIITALNWCGARVVPGLFRKMPKALPGIISTSLRHYKYYSDSKLKPFCMREFFFFWYTINPVPHTSVNGTESTRYRHIVTSSLGALAPLHARKCTHTAVQQPCLFFALSMVGVCSLTCAYERRLYRTNGLLSMIKYTR